MKSKILAGIFMILSMAIFAEEEEVKMNEDLKKALLKLEVEALERSGHPLNEKTHKNPRYKSEYFAEYQDNLFVKMSDEHIAQYGSGNGKEFADKRYPAKMKSIFSSSAMTFNLLGNNEICANDGNEYFVPGTYKIEYEKKLLTVKNSDKNQNPAHLDAFLLNGTNAIFCEMKMIEWMRDTPGFLKKAYSETKRSFFNSKESAEANAAFERLRKYLCENMSEYKADADCDPHRFTHYDAWQMYKHILGIYNMSSATTKNEVASLQTNEIKMLPKLKKVRLVNVIFEPPVKIFKNEKARNAYCNCRAIEHGEFDIFKQCVEGSGVIEAFKKDCGIGFSVELLTAAQFMDCFDISDSHKKYLQRYRLDK